MNNVLESQKSVFRAVLSRRMVICVFNGLSAGMPLFFVYHLIPAWLRSEQIDLKTIGLFSLVGIPYTWKFVWSPLMDRYVPPFLGRRRGWMLITQIGLIILMRTTNKNNQSQYQQYRGKTHYSFHISFSLRLRIYTFIYLSPMLSLPCWKMMVQHKAAPSNLPHQHHRDDL